MRRFLNQTLLSHFVDSKKADGRRLGQLLRGIFHRNQSLLHSHRLEPANVGFDVSQVTTTLMLETGQASLGVIFFGTVK